MSLNAANPATLASTYFWYQHKDHNVFVAKSPIQFNLQYFAKVDSRGNIKLEIRQDFKNIGWILEAYYTDIKRKLTKFQFHILEDCSRIKKKYAGYTWMFGRY